MEPDREILRLKRRITTLEKELYTDELTGIFNRRGLFVMLEPIFNAVKYEKANPGKRRRVVISELSVLFVDIDYFKKVNDTYGHAAGDQVLREVAGLIEHDLRGLDVVGRYGGEEIVVGLLGADASDAMKIAEGLRQKIAAATIVTGSKKIAVTASFGVANLGNQETLVELLKKADKALYKAKNSGRNMVVASK